MQSCVAYTERLAVALVKLLMCNPLAAGSSSGKPLERQMGLA